MQFASEVSSCNLGSGHENSCFPKQFSQIFIVIICIADQKQAKPNIGGGFSAPLSQIITGSHDGLSNMEKK